MPLGDRGRVERAGEADEDGVVGMRCGGRVGDLEGGDLGSLDQALGAQEPGGKLGLVARGPHRDRDGDRGLARPGGPDLEWGLAHEPVVAALDRPVTNDGHRHGGDVTGRGLAGGGIGLRVHRRECRAAQPQSTRPSVAVRSWASSIARLTASRASMSAGIAARPSASAQATARSAATPKATYIPSASRCASA